MLKNLCRQSIEEIYCRDKCIPPEFKWHGCLGQKSETKIYNMAMLALSSPLLLMCVRKGMTKFNAKGVKKKG